MNKKNICKFISEPSSDKLDTHRFIYETNSTAMKETSILKYNRMILVKNGNFLFHINKTQIEANTGSLIFAFADESICATATEGDEYLYIDFSGSRSNVLFKRFGINALNRSFNGFDGLIPFWHESLIRASHSNLDLTAESVLLYSISRIKPSLNKQNPLIQQILDITEETFNNPELSISSIAKQLAYNEKYISHLFKQKMGISYTEYLRMYRIKYAIMLMDHGIDSVKNIASLCGFSNPMYFSYVFKQAVGFSPSEYKSNRE